MSDTPQEPTPNTTNVGQKQHHRLFYIRDGSAVFELIIQPGVLYRLHASILTARSAVFESMFSLNQNDASTTTEGVTDDEPISLPLPLNATAMDFDRLLIYLYKGPSEHPKTDEFYVSVLQLSTFFQLEDGVQYAIAELERKGDNFDPALQFQLEYSSIQLRQLGQIGDIGCYHLIRTKDQIRKLRARLAFGTPALRPFKDCNTPGTCNWSWRREWWAGFARLIHHPDVHLPFSAIPDKLYEVQMAGIDGVCDDCLRLTINSILEDGKFGKEEEYISDAVGALMAYQTDEPIRAALRANHT
ncbi:hypothetical protein C8R44DRAFT_988260 [Mycena epipterygia]|nr:hypothetical protein C8R44DRAFT_988260 [Mycena epipterygia]